MSIISTALKTLKTVSGNEVSQSNFIDLVAHRTGCSKESVRGTLIGYSPHKLFGQDDFKAEWSVCRGHPARFIRKNTLAYGDVEYAIDYDTPEKKLSRERGLANVTKGFGTYLTLAGREGYCAKYIWSVCPTATIHNVECDPDILEHWRRYNYPTIDHLGKLSTIIRQSGFANIRFHLLNLDLMGYACDYLHQDFAVLNRLHNSKFITLTLQGQKDGFRNHGTWADWARTTFSGRDVVQQWLAHVFDAYRIIDSWSYFRDDAFDCRKMRMWSLKRR
jgi:hypothetical protein